MDLPRSLSAALDKIELELLNRRTTLLAEEEEDESELQELMRIFEKPAKPDYLASSLSDYQFSKTRSMTGNFVLESEWLILAKACVVVVRNLMQDLFARSLPLGQDIMYWEQLLNSRSSRSLYLLQTAPSRLYHFARAVAAKVTAQSQGEQFTLGTLRNSVFDRSLLRRFAFPHLSKNNVMKAPKLMSLDVMLRQEVRTKLAIVTGLRDAQAQAIGLLVAQAQIGAADVLAKEVIYITRLLETSATHASEPFTAKQNASFVAPSKDEDFSPDDIAQKLISLSSSFNASQASYQEQLESNTAPSALVRFWPLAIGGYFGIVVVSRYLSTRKEQLTISYREFLDTASGFWINWIVDPFKKILATIRHDEGSEVALLSSRSLSTDLESLERMVVDFAKDNPQFSHSATLDELRASARNGDLTPVLVAYEDNIKSPLRSALTGSLIRALLIQIQKTKVDVEVAINGIDKLLKSQELVFGFVSVSPALVVMWFGIQWFARILGKENRGQRNMRLSSVKILRNVDRLLCPPQDEQVMTYKRRGLVLCEAQLLRRYSRCMPRDLRHQYLEDLTDLERANDLQETRHIMTRIFRIYASNLAYK